MPSPAGRRDRAVEPPRSAIMPDGHHPATPQVTVMDDQFGTHTVMATTFAASSLNWPCISCVVLAFVPLHSGTDLIGSAIRNVRGAPRVGAGGLGRGQRSSGLARAC
jgi:hypothetical protein